MFVKIIPASVSPPTQIRRQSAFCKVFPSPVDSAPGRWSDSNRRRIWQRASTQPLVNSLKPRQNVQSNVLLGSLRFWQCSNNAFNSSWISFDRSLNNLIWKQSRLKKIWHGAVTKVLYIQESRKYRSNRVRPIRGQDNYQTRNLKMRKWIQLIRQLQTEKQLSISSFMERKMKQSLWLFSLPWPLS